MVDLSIAEGTAHSLEIELKEYCFGLVHVGKQVVQTDTHCYAYKDIYMC